MACCGMASAWYRRAKRKWCAKFLSQALILLLRRSGSGEGSAAALSAAAAARVHSIPRGERTLRRTSTCKFFTNQLFFITPEA